jgi:hypothetical protein
MAGAITSKVGNVSTIPVPIAEGGTASTTAAAARSNLGLGSELGWFSNLAVIRATTTNAGDSIKITSADGTALSASNFGLLRLAGTTAGQTTDFTVTADVTILLTGAHWGIGTTGDITGGVLRVLAINDNGALKWGVAYVGGRTTLLTTDTNATQTSITLPEKVLTTSAVGSATNSCRELGYFFANFDDTGGAAEDLWAVSSAINGCVTGQSADGIYQPWNQVYGGFSVNPTTITSSWTQIDRNIYLFSHVDANGTSNATTFTTTTPVKPGIRGLGVLPLYTDAGSNFTGGMMEFQLDNQTVLMYKANLVAWTAAGAKAGYFFAQHVAGPAASFI